MRLCNKERFFAFSDGTYKLYDINTGLVASIEFGHIYYIIGDMAFIDFERPKYMNYEHNTTGKIFRMSCGEGRYVYFHECYPGCVEEHMHGFGLMKEDGTILTKQIFEHIGQYSEGFISGNSFAWYCDYIDLDGVPVLFNFPDTCSEFIDGVAYIVTHDWADGMISAKTEISPEKPLANNVTTFLMNKTGDIVYLSFEEQREFLLKYQEARHNRLLTREWKFEEFINKPK